MGGFQTTGHSALMRRNPVWSHSQHILKRNTREEYVSAFVSVICAFMYAHICYGYTLNCGQKVSKATALTLLLPGRAEPPSQAQTTTLKLPGCS